MPLDKLTVILEFKGTTNEGIFSKPMVTVRVLEIEDVEIVVHSIDDALDTAKDIILDNYMDTLPEYELEDEEDESEPAAVSEGRD